MIFFIDAVVVIWMSSAGLFLGVTLNTSINLFVRTVRRIMSCIYIIFEALLEVKVAVTYALGCCNWYPYMRISAIAKYLSSSGTKLTVRTSTSSIIHYSLWITVKWYSSSPFAQKQIIIIVPSYSRIYLIEDQTYSQ